MTDFWAPFYSATSWAYTSFRDYMPESVRDYMDAHPEASMATLGLLGGYLVMRAGQLFLEQILLGVNPETADRIISIADLVGIGGTVLTPLAIGLADPTLAHLILSEHSGYSAGMAGAITGACIAGGQDIVERETRDAHRRGFDEGLRSRESTDRIQKSLSEDS